MQKAGHRVVFTAFIFLNISVGTLNDVIRTGRSRSSSSKKVLVMKARYTILFLLALILGACSSPQKLYEKGRYGKAVDEALELVRKGKADDRDLRALESAFNLANAKDIQQLEKLLNDPSPDRWEPILGVAGRIQQRQDVVQPYLPFTLPQSGKQVSLKLYPLRDMIPQARLKAADRRDELGMIALERAERGDKGAAREAFDHFGKSLSFRPGNQETINLRDRAENLSYSYMQLTVDNQARAFLPGGYRLRIEETFMDAVDHRWLRVVPEDDPCRDCDLETRIILADVDVSPDGVDERKRIERKTVEDGFQYVLDQRGNVMKDTNGNDIKVPVYKEVWAEVYDTRQFKAARLEGWMEIYDLRSRRVLKRIPLAAETQFRAESVWFKGDKRALTPETLKTLRNQPVPFPTEQAILSDAADLFRQEIGREARNERRLFIL